MDWTSLRHSSTCEELIECSPCVPTILLTPDDTFSHLRLSLHHLHAYVSLCTKRVPVALPVTADSDSLQLLYNRVQVIWRLEAAEVEIRAMPRVPTDRVSNSPQHLLCTIVIIVSTDSRRSANVGKVGISHTQNLMSA